MAGAMSGGISTDRRSYVSHARGIYGNVVLANSGYYYRLSILTFAETTLTVIRGTGKRSARRQLLPARALWLTTRRRFRRPIGCSTRSSCIRLSETAATTLRLVVTSNTTLRCDLLVSACILRGRIYCSISTYSIHARNPDHFFWADMEWMFQDAEV